MFNFIIRIEQPPIGLISIYCTNSPTRYRVFINRKPYTDALFFQHYRQSVGDKRTTADLITYSVECGARKRIQSAVVAVVLAEIEVAIKQFQENL